MKIFRLHCDTTNSKNYRPDILIKRGLPLKNNGRFYKARFMNEEMFLARNVIEDICDSQETIDNIDFINHPKFDDAIMAVKDQRIANSAYVFSGNMLPDQHVSLIPIDGKVDVKPCHNYGKAISFRDIEYELFSRGGEPTSVCPYCGQMLLGFASPAFRIACAKIGADPNSATAVHIKQGFEGAYTEKSIDTVKKHSYIQIVEGQTVPFAYKVGLRVLGEVDVTFTDDMVLCKFTDINTVKTV